MIPVEEMMIIPRDDLTLERLRQQWDYWVFSAPYVVRINWAERFAREVEEYPANASDYVTYSLGFATIAAEMLDDCQEPPPTHAERKKELDQHIEDVLAEYNPSLPEYDPI